jgi:hypothetical protein
MTKLTGYIKDSGGAGLTGHLKVILDSPLSAGSKTLVLKAHSFPVIDGNLDEADIELEPSASSQTTYRLMFYTSVGLTELVWLDFHCIIPQVASVAITQLLPTGVVSETLDTSIIRLADLISTDAYYSSKVTPLKFRGLWRDDSLYYRGDVVEYDGSSYIYRLIEPGQNKLPTNDAFWQVLAGRGLTGIGTGGNASNYGISWQDKTDSPSRGAIYNLVESTLVKQGTVAGFAPIDSPTLTGVPSTPTADSDNATSQIASTAFVANYSLPKANPTLITSPGLGSSNKSVATTEWVNATITAAGGFGGGVGSIDLTGYAQLTSPNFSGNPTAPTQTLSNNSNRIATTKFVTDKLEALPAATGVTVSTSGGITTFNYGGGNLMMCGTLNITRASWNYLSWNNLVVNFPFSLATFYNVQCTWRDGLTADTGYMKYRVNQTSETSITISAMWSNSYYDAVGSFYWMVLGKQ